MKSQVEVMRALVYFCVCAIDKSEMETGEEAKKWKGIVDLLVPVVKAYCTDMGFKVTEQAIQIYGGAGYTHEFPVEQLMRDLKIGSIYEGTNGIQSLDLVGRKLGLDKGQPFKNLFGMMMETIAKAKTNTFIADLVTDAEKGVQALGGTAAYFASCFQGGDLRVPIVKAYPFLNLFGNVALGWLHLWQADLASEKLQAIISNEGIAGSDKKAIYALTAKNTEAAFYFGKIKGATYYIKNVLPEAIATSKIIQNDDMSILEIPDESFGF